MFRVGLSSDFLTEKRVKDDGKLDVKFCSFDLAPLERNPNVETVVVQVVDGRIPNEAVADVDALILLSAKFDKDSVPRGPDSRLAVVARFGVGFDTVDVEACTAAGIAVTITPDGVRRPVAVSILTFILALSTKLIPKNRLGKEGQAGFDARAQFMGVGLTGKTLGTIGLGNIGAEMFRLAAPLDMKHMAHDPFADETVADELGVKLVELDELFRESDFLAVNCPLNSHTAKIVNAKRLATMKPSAYVINTARGGVIDQAALANALRDNAIAGAALDVFDPEPPSVDDPIFGAGGENLITTPHAICWTDECFGGIGASTVVSSLAVVAGKVPAKLTLVNKSIAEDSTFLARLQRNAERMASAGASAGMKETGAGPVAVPRRMAHDPNTGTIRPNRVKQVLASGGTAFIACGELNWTAGAIDAMVGPSGCDGVWLEGEHGPLDYGDLGNLSRACDLWGITAIARVQKSCDKPDENTIYRHLDGGVQGIIVPKVNTKEQAEVVAAACKFKTPDFPQGRRGMFVSRQGYGVKNYFMQANDTVLTVVLIEDVEAVRNIDEILTVDGIDVFFVAFADLAQSMGYLHDLFHPEVQRVTAETITKIAQAGKVAGSTPCSVEEAKKHRELGVRFFYTQPLSMASGGLEDYIAAVDPVRHSL